MSDTNPFDELRKVLEARAIATANEVGIGEVTEIDGYAGFDPPKDALWAHFNYKMGETYASAMGQGDVGDEERPKFQRTVGIVEWTILYPENSPKGEPTRIADAIRRKWALKQWTVADVGHVRTGAAGQKPIPLAPRGWKRVLVETIIDFHFRA